MSTLRKKRRAASGGKRANDERKLDQALEDTFPGSDPVALTQPAPQDAEDDSEDRKETSGPARPTKKR